MTTINKKTEYDDPNIVSPQTENVLLMKQDSLYEQKRLIWEIGDLIHGALSGSNITNTENKTNGQIIHNLLSLSIRTFYDKRNNHINDYLKDTDKTAIDTFKLSQQEKMIVNNLLVLYGKQIIKHYQMIKLCQLLFFDWNIKNALKIIVDPVIDGPPELLDLIGHH